MTSPRHRADIDIASLLADIAAHRQGDEEAAGRLALALRSPLRIAAEQYLGRDHGDIEDVVQDATLSALRYLCQDGEFKGDPMRLAVAIARNRCRDLCRWRRTKPEVEIVSMENWLADGASSPLDEMIAAERVALVQDLLASLPDGCRQLLHALYVAGQTPESLRKGLGVTTVQGVYYRRGVCLEMARKALQKRMSGRSLSDRVRGRR